MKAGELQGIRDLTPEVADCVLPRVIVPPVSERDETLQAELFESLNTPDVSAALSAHWVQRDVLVEATHLIDDFGREKLGLWLPAMFERARKSQVRAIPLVQLRDLIEEPGAFGACVDRAGKLQLGVVMSSGDLGDRELLEGALRSLEGLRLDAENCLVIADFHDADLSAPEVVAPIIAGALDELQSRARWRQIVFQGTHYPEKNPADPDAYHIVPRNEWLAWRRAVSFDPTTAQHLLFGDYAADCAKLVFGEGGGRAIRHYRYATSDAWWVQRGSKTGRDEEIMRKVCEQLLTSGHFAGRGFSSADDYIFKTAHGHAGPGNAKDWRAINTTHHITRVVADAGSVKGVLIHQKVLEPLATQAALFS
jgi:hypothetical protein